MYFLDIFLTLNAQEIQIVKLALLQQVTDLHLYFGIINVKIITYRQRVLPEDTAPNFRNFG